MTSDRPAPEVSTILSAALRRPARLGSCRLICIDGPAGSGKTTLAAAVVGALSGHGTTVSALHMDDFYEGWSGLQENLEPRMLSQVFEPLARGVAGRWQRYDWHRGAFGDWLALPVPDYLVVEGCGSGARGYEPYRSLLVFVEAERDTRLRRGIERDGPAVEPQWLAWMEREQAHFDLNETRESADLLFSTENT